MRTICVALLALLGCASAIAAQDQKPAAGSTLTRYDREASIGMLEQIQADLKDHYYDPADHGLDLEQICRDAVARVVQLEKRGTVIGDRTAGAVMTGRLIPHIYGTGRLTLYAVMITVGDVRLTDGGSLEKVGVTPDQIVPPTAADLVAKRDPVLAQAIERLGGRMTPEKAGRLFHEDKTP